MLGVGFQQIQHISYIIFFSQLQSLIWSRPEILLISRKIPTYEKRHLFDHSTTFAKARQLKNDCEIQKRNACHF